MGESKTILMALNCDIEKIGLKSIFSTSLDFLLVGEVANLFEIETFISCLRPDILIIGPNIFDSYLSEIGDLMCKICQKVPVIIYSSIDHPYFISEVIGWGAIGFLKKDVSERDLFTLLYQAIDGKVLFSKDQIIAASKWKAEIGIRINCLTKREGQVLIYLTKGQTNMAIAKKMNLSVKTIETYVSKILMTLGLSSRSEIICWYYNNFPISHTHNYLEDQLLNEVYMTNHAIKKS